MKNHFISIALLLTASFISACNSAPVTPQSHENHGSHSAEVNERGDKAMGFSHEKTTHHFRLYTNGGAIQVTANDAKDSESTNQIRKHLSHIAQMFADGNFDAPMLTHGKTPAGVPVLQKLKSDVKYTYEEITNGGQVGITTNNQEALTAIYEFMRFQISDHQTGDSIEVTKQ
jgi:hypothetical protein